MSLGPWKNPAIIKSSGQGKKLTFILPTVQGLLYRIISYCIWSSLSYTDRYPLQFLFSFLFSINTEVLQKTPPKYYFYCCNIEDNKQPEVFMELTGSSYLAPWPPRTSTTYNVPLLLTQKPTYRPLWIFSYHSYQKNYICHGFLQISAEMKLNF